MTTEPTVLTEQHWHTYALHLRYVLEHVGVTSAPCLPGEAEECGTDAAQHAVAYAVVLVAKAEHVLWHLHHGDPETERNTAELLEQWRSEFANTSCADEPWKRVAHR